MDNTLNSEQVVTRAGETTSIPFHRHCQKTVLSAYGPDGQGATWDRISGLTLKNFPSDWKDYFTSNRNDITQDLASILMLINRVSAASYKVQMQKVSGSTVTNVGSQISPVLDPDQESNPGLSIFKLPVGKTVTLTFNGDSTKAFKFNTLANDTSAQTLNVSLNRTIELHVNGEPLRFGTLVRGSDEVLEANLFSSRPVMFRRDWAEQSRLTALVPYGTSTATLNVDLTSYNLVPWKGGGDITSTSDTRTLSVVLENQNHVQRLNFYNSLEFDSWLISLGGTYESGIGKNILTCELHMHNCNPEGGAVVTLPQPTMTGYVVVPLTDLLVVEPGKTNVYVVRVDPGQTTDGGAGIPAGTIVPPTLTYSLAYIY